MTNKKINILKKNIRIFNKFLLIILFKIIYPLFRLMGITITPPYNEIRNFKYSYSPETRRLVFNGKQEETFNKIFIDTSLNISTLCELGKKFSTNKSPINMNGHRSGFTGSQFF